jgi:hypothetical protein
MVAAAHGPALAAAQLTQQRTSPIDKEVTMSKSRLAQTLVLAALLAATNLVGMTAVAHATGGSAVIADGARPPTEGQVGEPWHPRVHAPTPPAEPDSQPRWPVAALTALAAALVLAGGLAAKRASRRTRLGHAA